MGKLPWPELRGSALFQVKTGLASRAVVGGMVMSKWVSKSCCHYGAAAQSKSLSVGHLEHRQKQAPRDVRLHCCLHSSPWLRGQGFNYSRAPPIVLSYRVKATRHWESNIRAQVLSYICLLKCFRMSSRVVRNKKYLTVLKRRAY